MKTIMCRGTSKPIAETRDKICREKTIYTPEGKVFSQKTEWVNK